MSEHKPTEFERDLAAWRSNPDYTTLKTSYLDLLRGTKRDGLEILIAALEKVNTNGMTFFDEPASTKFHGKHLGGLVDHSLQVRNLFNSYNQVAHLEIPQDSVEIATLLHDLCKWQTYQANITTKGEYSKTAPFFVEDMNPLGHGEKSVVILARYIDLTPKEELLIRWHMGPYDYNWKYNESRVTKVCRAVDFMYLADNLASKLQGLED